MSDPVSALGHAVFNGFAAVREIGPLGMIALRARADLAALPAAVAAATGLGLPAVRRRVTAGDLSIGWMSPDEWLIVLPYPQVGQTLARLAQALQGQHHLAVDVSDARAVFRIEGAGADDVLMKLAPVDLARLEPDEVRRTRAAQVACALWREGDGYTLVCFRSVAVYVMGLLTQSAQPGSAIFPA